MRHNLTFLLFLFGCQTWAQNKEPVLIRKYTQKDGINSYNIRRVTEDEWGFIWIGTQDGLSRFDGKNFSIYTKSAPPRRKICGSDVREIVADGKEHLLWVLPDDVGINAINTLTGDVVKTVRIPYSNGEDWNICMTKDGDYLWIGTFAGVKLYNIRSRHFERLPAIRGDTSNPVEFEVRSITRDSQGNLWVAYSGHGIVIYDGPTKAILRTIPVSALNDHLHSHSIRFLKGIEATPGTMLFATNQGLRKIGFDRLYTLSIDNEPCKAFPRLATEPLEWLARRKKDILIAGYSGLIALDTTLRSGSLLQEHVGASDSKWLDAVQCVFADHNGNTWLGCQEGLGFINGKRTPFDPYVYDPISNLKLDHVRSLLPLPNGDILAGLRNGIVHIDHNNRTFTLYDQPHLYHHLFEDPNGRIVASRFDGLFVFSNGRPVPIAKVYPEFKGFDGISVNSHIFLDDSLVVLGTESNGGILLWNHARNTVRRIHKGAGKDVLFSNIVNNIYLDSLHRLWVLSDNSISLLSPGLTKSRELTLPFNLFFDMCEAGGDYFIAAYGSGILQLDPSFRLRRVINSAGGLANDGVYQVYNLSDRRLLVTTNNGISLVDLPSGRCANYTAVDGLHSDGFEEVCGCRKGGLIYAGGLNGFTVIDPSALTTDTVPPKFYFTGIHTQLKDTTQDTTNLRMTTLTIPNNWLQTTVSFTGIHYANPTSVHYQYRILEQDSTWLNLGTLSSLNLVGLAPGNYTLEARAFTEARYPSPPARFHLIFNPKWYETLWFQFGLLLTAGLLLYALYRFRINEMRKQQQIRSGIASDLHDDIGSLLNSVKVFSHLARTDPSAAEHFRNIDETLVQANTGLRDMIWVLDNSEDTIGELMDRIRKHALPITTACGITLSYSFDVPDKQAAVSKTEKRNLLLIAKEAINNSIKYSGCGMISIACTQGRNGFCLRIADDGRGFDPGEPLHGNGLRNMKERATQIRYHCHIESCLTKGVAITVTK